jgi:hypothetical protein
VLRSRLASLNIVVAIIGVALLVFTVQRVGGCPAIVSGITTVGWWFIAVVMLGAARMAARGRAWMVCLDAVAEPGAPRLSHGEAFRAILAGDTAGNLTPLGVFASEPTKILMTRGKISTVASIASVAIENAFYTASVLIVLLAGTWLFLQRANVPVGLEQISEIILVAVAIAGAIAIWAARTQPAVLSRLAPVIAKLAGRAHAPADAVKDVEARIYGVLRWPFGRILHVASWEAVFHVLAVTEVWVILRVLIPDVTVGEAFLLESAGRFVTVAFKFVPYRLGIDEMGSGAVAQVLGLGPANGVTLALVRRLRIIVLNVAGVGLLVRRR